MRFIYERVFGSQGDSHFASYRGGVLYSLLFLPPLNGTSDAAPIATAQLLAGVKATDAAWSGAPRGDAGGVPLQPMAFPDTEPTTGWLVYNDTSYGMTLARSGYILDGSDVIVQHTAKARQCYQCHSSSDLNGFRVIGAGSTWVTGAGRVTRPQG